MEIDKVFDNASVDGVADNLFSAVRNSVSEIKAMQQRKAAENVQLVIQALKKIESDLQDKYDGVTTVIEKRVSTIKDGRDGINGRDGRDGKDGRPGKDGMPGPRGRDGAPGKDGVDGMDGVSVTDARIDFDGSLIIGLSSGREINVGEVVAPDLAERIKVITNGGGTSQSVLDTLASLQSQINALDGFLDYKGTWNASTNTPTLVSSTGTKGDYYVVSVAGSTNLNGETTWGVGDWVVFNNSVWQKVDGGSTGNFTTAAIATSLNLAYGTVSTALALDASKNVVSVTNTGTGNNVLAGSPTLTGTVNAAAVTMSSNLTLSGGTANGVAYLNGSKVLTTGSAMTFDGNNLSIGANGQVGSRLTVIANGAMATFNTGAAADGRIEYAYNGTNIFYTGVNSASLMMLMARSGVELGFGANNSEQMRLNSTGLGIGTSSPGVKLDVVGTTTSGLRLRSSSGAANGFNLYNDSSTDIAYLMNFYNGSMVFGTNNTERARITSAGVFIVGDTAVVASGFAGVKFDGASYNGLGLNDSAAASGAGYIYFQSSGTTIGSITRVAATSAVAYNTTSDQRLKENIKDAAPASALIDALQVREYDWKSDGSHQRYGFIAQELVSVAPEAVHQPVDPDEMMGVDYSKLVPMLVKEIQSLRKRVAQLEGA